MRAQVAGREAAAWFTVRPLFATVAPAGYRLAPDRCAQRLRTPAGEALAFAINPFRQGCLIERHDDSANALMHAARIRAFEAQRRIEAPWLCSGFQEGSP